MAQRLIFPFEALESLRTHCRVSLPSPNWSNSPVMGPSGYPPAKETFPTLLRAAFSADSPSLTYPIASRNFSPVDTRRRSTFGLLPGLVLSTSSMRAIGFRSPGTKISCRFSPRNRNLTLNSVAFSSIRFAPIREPPGSRCVMYRPRVSSRPVSRSRNRAVRHPESGYRRSDSPRNQDAASSRNMYESNAVAVSPCHSLPSFHDPLRRVPATV